MTSSDKKYRRKRKDKILFILLSNTLMKKKISKNKFFRRLRGVYIFFFDKSPFLTHFPSFHRWWLVLILKIMLYNYLEAGYEVRLTISLSGVLEPLKSDLRRLRFFSPASLDINSQFSKYILPMTPEMPRKRIYFFKSSFWCQNRVSKIAFF